MGRRLDYSKAAAGIFIPIKKSIKETTPIDYCREVEGRYLDALNSAICSYPITAEASATDFKK